MLVFFAMILWGFSTVMTVYTTVGAVITPTGAVTFVKVQPHFIPGCFFFTAGVLLLYFATFYKNQGSNVQTIKP